jgi:hypothetical protein
MSEPIKLYKPGGETVNVYGENQARAMLDSGQWFATQADAEAGKVRPEPTPATAAKLDALEGDATGAVEPTPAEPAPAKPTAAKRTASGKGGL